MKATTSMTGNASFQAASQTTQNNADADIHERMQRLESYFVTLKTRGEKFPRHVGSKKPHFHMISAATGVHFSYLVKEPYRQRIVLAAEEIGFTEKQVTDYAAREARFNQNRTLLVSYFKWLETNGLKLPEEPIHRGKIFFAQAAIEAGLSPQALTLKIAKHDHSYSNSLREMVEKACTTLGSEVRVLPQRLDYQRTSLTYLWLIKRGTEERKQALKDKPSSTQQLYNTRSALNLFLKALHLQKTACIGIEFTTTFKESSEKVISEIVNFRSRKKFKTEIHWWRDFYQRLVKEPAIPDDFHQALVHLIDRSGLTISVLAKLMGVRNGHLGSWYRGTTSATAMSIEALCRMEQLFKLPIGALTDKIKGRVLGLRFKPSQLPLFLQQDPATLRRVRKHLPDDFCSLPLEKQEQIVRSIDTEIVRGDDSYSKNLVELTRLPYRLAPWPEDLRQEFDAFANFKMADRPPLGMKRNGKWRPATKKKHETDFGHFFGALHLSADNEDARLRGLGLPESHLTLALIACPLIVDWYIRFKYEARNHYSRYAIDMLHQLMAILRPATGWLRQNPQLSSRLKEVHLNTIELIPGGLIARAQNDWNEVCDSAIDYYKHLITEIEPLVTVARDPFLRIEGIVNMDDPMEAIEHLIQGMRKNVPSVHSQPVFHHTAVRNCALVSLFAVTGLRRNTVVQLDYTGDKCGHLYKEGGWYVLSIPRRLFKEENSPFFGPRHDQKDYFMELPRVLDLNAILDEYLNVSRPFLMGRYHKACKEQPLFVNSAWAHSNSSKERSARMKTYQVYGIYAAATELHLVENKWRGTGLAQVKKHGPHSVRHIRGTKAVKATGSFQIAADANHNSEQISRKHYARFVPRNRNRRVNNVLFRKEDDDGGNN